jgi:hypothetical protein
MSVLDCAAKPFVHLAIDAVDTVVYDPEGHLDPERFDHYDSYVAARDAALSSIEVMLDEADYDGDDHREELEQMLALLESSSTYEELMPHPGHRRILDRLSRVHPAAA